MASTVNYWSDEDINFEPPGLQGYAHDSLSHIVVDDFLDDPVMARELVMNLNFEAPPDPKHGVISFNGKIPQALMEQMRPKIEELLSKKIEYHPRSKCALTFAHTPTNSVCHVDGGDNMRMFNWTVIVYLNLPEQCRGGTSLFRHRATGHVCNKNGVEYYASDFSDSAKWELLEEVGMKFNRALLLPAWLFHSLSFTFGDSVENARMTLNPKVVAVD